MLLPDGWALWWSEPVGAEECWLVRRAGSPAWFEAWLRDDEDTADTSTAEIEQLARALARSPHEGLPRVAAVIGDRAVISESTGGASLQGLGRRVGGLPAASAAGLAVDLAGAAEHLHRLTGAAHGHLIPSRMELTHDGRLRLTFPWDLPAHRAPAQGMVAIPHDTRYFSPEAAIGRKVDARADVWGIGMMLREWLTGKPPFAGQQTLEHLGELCGSGPLPSLHELPASVPSGLAAIVRRALARAPEDRFPTAGALATALRGWRDEEGTASPLAGPAALFDLVTSPLDRAVSGWMRGEPLDDALRQQAWETHREAILEPIRLGRLDRSAVVASTVLHDVARGELQALRGRADLKGFGARWLDRLLGAGGPGRPPRRVRVGPVLVTTCDLPWSQLRAGGAPDLRHCDVCGESVRRVEGVEALVLQAGRGCLRFVPNG